MKQKVEIEVPDGWELTGEFRRALVGEHILETIPLRAVKVLQPMGSEGARLILRKVEPTVHKRKVWLNCYADQNPVLYLSRELADRRASRTRIACIEREIEFTDGEGLEPLSEEGA